MKHPNIRSLDALSQLVTNDSRPLCLYSGGLDGTYLLYFLSQLGCSRILALTVDLGGAIDQEAVHKVCERLGVQWLLLDRREEFAEEFVTPAIAAQARYLGGHPICASLSRPMMVKVACEIAVANNCDMILHTSNRSQNSLRRFNGALSSLGFRGSFGSPFDLSSISREEKIETLKAAGIDMFNGRLHSSDSNLWGREFESGDLDDPEKLALPEPLYEWTKPAAAKPGYALTIEFQEGIPVCLNGSRTDFLTIIRELNLIGGSYGLGRFEGLEEIEGGIKVQEVREMPAAYVLLDAYRRLEAGCLSAECIREKMHLEQLWVREAVEGRWYDPLRSAAQAFIRSLAKSVTGSVSYELSAHNLQVTSVKAAKPVYIRDRTRYEQTQGN